MTKAQKIIDLAALHPDWDATRIASACDCLPSYVRVVLRQRRGSCQSETDKRYRAAHRETINAKSKVYWKDYWAQHGKEVKARRRAKKALRKAEARHAV